MKVFAVFSKLIHLKVRTGFDIDMTWWRYVRKQSNNNRRLDARLLTTFDVKLMSVTSASSKNTSSNRRFKTIDAPERTYRLWRWDNVVKQGCENPFQRQLQVRIMTRTTYILWRSVMVVKSTYYAGGCTWADRSTRQLPFETIICKILTPYSIVQKVWWSRANEAGGCVNDVRATQ
jgi:hypothetical protein